MRPIRPKPLMPTLIAIFIPFDFVDKNRVNEAIIVRTQYNLATLFFEKKCFFAKKAFELAFLLEKSGYWKDYIYIYILYAVMKESKTPRIAKYKTDKFFVCVYVCVAAMVVLQIAIIVWAAVS